MQRREFPGSTVAASIAVFGGGLPAARADAPAPATAQPLPRRERVKVAFMLGHHANVIDTMGPWEVFQDASTPDGDDAPFELCTVAPEDGLLEMTGGLKLRPH